MSDLELCYLPATEAIDRFKAKTLSPVELLTALIDRAEFAFHRVSEFIGTTPIRKSRQTTPLHRNWELLCVLADAFSTRSIAGG